jgi:LemA protein
MNILYIVLGVLVLGIVFVIGKYNSLIGLRNRVKEAWADIDVQLKRRFDLIPNLVNTVKGYAEHESGIFERVTEARSHAMQANTVAEKSQADNMLTGTLKSLFAVAEAYPDLKANQNFLELQKELSDTENKIQAARRFYNGNVRDWNTAVQIFPSNIIASMFNFKEAEFFELEQDSVEKEPVKVSF